MAIFYGREGKALEGDRRETSEVWEILYIFIMVYLKATHRRIFWDNVNCPSLKPFYTPNRINV